MNDRTVSQDDARSLAIAYNAYHDAWNRWQAADYDETTEDGAIALNSVNVWAKALIEAQKATGVVLHRDP